MEVAKSVCDRPDNDIAIKIIDVGGGGWLGQAIIKAMLSSGVVWADELAIFYRCTPPRDTAASLTTRDS